MWHSRSAALGIALVATAGPVSAQLSNVAAPVVISHYELNVTSVVVSHDIRSVFRMASKVALLSDKKITFFGTPEEMAADISHSQLVVLDKCGHMAPLEKPAEVSAALRRWLKQ